LELDTGIVEEEKRGEKRKERREEKRREEKRREEFNAEDALERKGRRAGAEKRKAIAEEGIGYS
jgi:hypothetical protein